MKLKLMIALVVLALVFGMTFTACDDGEASDIKYTIKDDGTVTTTIHDAGLIGTYDQSPKKSDGSANPNFGKYSSADDTTDKGFAWNNPSNPDDGYHFDKPVGWGGTGF
jgi:ABC-type proline/glycine betaine transport system substrate-binding protein